MAKKKIKRESIIIAAGFVLTAATIAAAVALTSVLSRDLNRFLSAGDNPAASEPIKFNFQAYDALGL
jgi:hypothetical protein